MFGADHATPVILSLISSQNNACPYRCSSGSRVIDVRVGVIAFEDFGGRLQTWERRFADIVKRSQTPLRIQIAVGTYGDVLHWLESGLIDARF